MAAFLRRGLAAGLLAGLAAGLFLLLAGEPAIEAALAYEDPRAAGGEVFSRATQKVGLVTGAGLYGLALGGLFGLAFALLGPQLRGGAWERALKLAAAGFAVVFLVPFLKYPANPPGVGEAATAAARTSQHFLMLLASLAAGLAAWVAARRLARAGQPAPRRHLLVAAGYLTAVGAAWALLPGTAVTSPVPAQVVWDTRLASLGGQALLWALLGVVFGLLTLRGEGPAAAGPREGVTAGRA